METSSCKNKNCFYKGKYLVKHLSQKGGKLCKLVYTDSELDEMMTKARVRKNQLKKVRYKAKEFITAKHNNNNDDLSQNCVKHPNIKPPLLKRLKLISTSKYDKAKTKLLCQFEKSVKDRNWAFRFNLKQHVDSVLSRLQRQIDHITSITSYKDLRKEIDEKTLELSKTLTFYEKWTEIDQHCH